MTITDIINVLTVSEERSFTKAANRLYISQSAISQSISKLERELGVLLFLRSTNSVMPTESCHIFLDTGSQIIRLFNQLKSDMQKQSAEPRLRIGTVSFFNHFLPFHEEFELHSSLHLRIEVLEDSSARIETMTANHELDFCFTRRATQREPLEFEPLFSETLLFAVPASHPVCQEYADSPDPYPVISPGVFSDSPFVMITNPRITHRCLQLCTENGFTPNIQYRTSEWNHVANYVISGKAIGFLSCLYIQENSHNPQIRFFRIDSPLSVLEHVVAYVSKSSLSSEALLYIRLFREYLYRHLPHDLIPCPPPFVNSQSKFHSGREREFTMRNKRKLV